MISGLGNLSQIKLPPAHADSQSRTRSCSFTFLCKTSSFLQSRFSKYWLTNRCHKFNYSQEAYSAADINTATGATLDIGLSDLEKSGAAKKNEGFFEKGLLKAMESDHLAGGNAREVKVVANGHSHREC